MEVAMLAKVPVHFQMDKALPAEKANIEFSMDDGGSSDVTQTIDPEGAKALNGGQDNKLGTETLPPEIVKLKEKGATSEAEIGKEGGQKQAVVPQKPKNKLGSLDALKPTTTTSTGTETKTTSGEEGKKERDYSMFPEAQREHFKKMGGEAYDFLKVELPRLQAKEQELAQTQQQLKELWGGEIPKHLGQHPRAYELHPQYQALSNQYNQVEFEKNFAYQQLVKLKAGEPFQMLKGYKKDSGQPVYETIEAGTSAHEVELSQMLNAASNVGMNVRQQLSNMQNNYTKGYDNDLKYIEQIKSDRWPGLKNPNDPIHADIAEFMEAVPQRFHDHPSTLVSAALYSDYKKALAMIDELKRTQITNGKIKDDKALMDPRPNGSSGSNGNGATLEGAALRSRIGIAANSKYSPPV
jgi:hypothetical protein